MIDKAIYVPLFTELSTAVESPFFTVIPGEIAMLQAFGFAEYRSRASSAELQVPQVACLEMLLFAEGVLPPREPGTCPLYSLKDYYTKVLARETMQRDKCSFSLSSCNNIMLINIPGSYCLTMEDETALGHARVYLRTFTHEEFPWDSKFFIGE